jgi:RimJ/RimL family protein N-acetyltransferase
MRRMRQGCWVAEFQIRTERLILRDWRAEDIAPLHSLCSDPAVMQYLGELQTRDEIEAIIERQHKKQAELGHCFWALERQDSGETIGFCGLQPGPEKTPIEGKTEIGWRLAYPSWGQGFAKEAAQAALAWGFANLEDDRIWAITVPANERSWGLMQRLGMTRHEELDFGHPYLSDNSPLKRHVTYSLGR